MELDFSPIRPLLVRGLEIGEPIIAVRINDELDKHILGTYQGPNMDLTCVFIRVGRGELLLLALSCYRFYPD